LRVGAARLPGPLKQGRLVALLILAFIVAAHFALPAPFELLRMRSFDILQSLFPRQPSEQPVAIVDIDDASLARIGQWPWPRTVLARLVDRLTALGAVVIGFDVVFPEPDRTSPDRIAQSLDGLDAETREALKRLPSNDRVFADALRRGHVVLGESARSTALAGAEGAAAPKAPLVRIGGDPRPWLRRFPGIVRDLPELEDAAAGRGMFTIEAEADGIVRRVPLVINVGGALFPALTFDMLRVATRESVAVRTGSTGIEDVLVGPYSIPTDYQGRVWVHYAPHEKRLYISAADVLSGAVDPARIAGKFVLIGTSAIGLNDNKTTPLDPLLPGVEVHAQLLETVLGNSYIRRPNWADDAETILVVLVGLLIIWLVPRTGARWTLLVLLLTAAAITLGAAWLYARHAFMLDFSLPLLTATLLYIYLVYDNHSREEGERRRIRNAFSQYLAPAVVEQVASDPAKLALGGEHRRMTFLFSDIRNFTAISEGYRDDPAGLTRLVNRHMTPMTDTILAHRGTIDKYIGDCVMAFWNAPLADADHPRNACLAALGMMRELAALNARLAAEAEEGEAQQRADGEAGERHRIFTRGLAIGIGINTGDCIVGNMGSALRLSYTVLGDAVNLASRLESQSRAYGVTAIIGEDTQSEVADFAAIEADLIAVKGRSAAVRIFALLGGPEEASSAGHQALRRSHDAMIAAYRARDWEAARAALSRCRPLEPRLAALYDLYESRIAAFERDPPPPGWTGVHVAKTK
jgi:adenylate cyclase